MVMEETNDVECVRCNTHCFGEVIKVGMKHYHQDCFTCKVSGCNRNLIQNGYFDIEGEYYCREDYHKIHGGCNCARCHNYVEGEAVSLLDSLYHPSCFSCFYCDNVFLPNIEVCYDGEILSCKSCPVTISNDVVADQSFDISDETVSPRSDETASPDLSPRNCTDESNNDDEEVTYSSLTLSHTSKCANCNDDIGERQSLVALEKSWHLSCFMCHQCGKLLADEYIGKDGVPYCEEDYQMLFGVRCAGCSDYITGKVLQAGGKHYHPSCACCGKCKELFGEGEEMYIRGEEIWHPSCSDQADLEAMSITSADVSDSSLPNGFPSSDVQAEENVDISTPAVGVCNEAPEEKNGAEDEEVDVTPPPVPLPPRRSSSSSWRLKYSGVYTAKPFQKSAEKKLSRVEPFIPQQPREVSTPLSVITDGNHLDTLHTEHDVNQYSPSQKGIGFNRLQYRRSLRENETKT